MKTGNQKPTFKRVGKYAYSIGDEVAEMFEEDAGATFYPSQREELRLMLAKNADGSPAASAIGISKARQNGKSYAARFYAIFAADFEHMRVLYSAHHSSTTAKMFAAMAAILDNPERFPDFAADVRRISRARGYEGFYFQNWKNANGEIQEGGYIEFATRTNSGSRGGTYDIIIVDEAQELTDEQQDAMQPTVSATSDANDTSKAPLIIYIGTPPGPTCKGTVFQRLHDKAHGTKRKSGEWWLEWGLVSRDITADIPTATDAVRIAYRTNPAMGYRIAKKTVMTEFATMSLDGFARERLGWWKPPPEEKPLDMAIDPKAWDACASAQAKPEGKTAYGIKFSIDGAEVVLCGAVCPTDGPARVSMIERRSTAEGVQWLAEWLNQRYTRACCVVIDGRNGVDVLIDRIAATWRMKGSIVRPSARDMIAAVSTLTTEIDEQTVTWYKEQAQLRDSALSATKRNISGGWGFGGANSAPIEAAALALWGCRNSKRDPTKKMRIG